MKNLTIICCFLLATFIYIIAFHTEDVKIKGRIVEKHAVPDKSGHIHYRVLAEFEDGRYRELEGMTYYVQPVNSTVYYETIRIK